MNLSNKLMNVIGLMKDDFEGALSYIDKDVVWINFLPDHVPFGGEYRGHEGLAQYFNEMAETFVIGNYIEEKFEFIEDGNTLVFIGAEEDAKALSTGKVFDLPFVWVVKFNDAGKISYLREHNDTAAIGDAFRA